VSADRSASRRRIHIVLLFVSVTTIHFVASIVLLLYVFGIGMARFDSGAPESPAESVMGWAFAILSFPFLTLLERLPVARFPGLWGYVPFLLNSCVWGLAAVVVRWRLRARASQRSADA
jgi:hypothetical protein